MATSIAWFPLEKPGFPQYTHWHRLSMDDLPYLWSIVIMKTTYKNQYMECTRTQSTIRK